MAWLLLLQKDTNKMFVIISMMTLTPRKIQRYILLPAVIPTCQTQKTKQ